MVNSFNPCTREEKAARSLWVLGQVVTQCCLSNFCNPTPLGNIRLCLSVLFFVIFHDCILNFSFIYLHCCFHSFEIGQRHMGQTGQDNLSFYHSIVICYLATWWWFLWKCMLRENLHLLESLTDCRQSNFFASC